MLTSFCAYDIIFLRFFALHLEQYILQLLYLLKSAKTMIKNGTILIVYETRRLRQYICVSGFFSFCGFIVTGIPADEASSEQLSSGTNIVVLLGETEFDNQDIPVIQMPLDTSDVGCSDSVIKLIDEIVKKNCLDDKTGDILRNIQSVYIQHSLWIHEYNLQQYFCLKEEVPIIYKQYLEASIQINSIVEKSDKNPYAWYAFCQGVRRMHELSNYIHKSHALINQEHLDEDLNAYIEKYPEFVSFYALKGYMEIASNRKEVALQTLTDYSEMLEEYSNVSAHVSDVLYSVGRLYEHFSANDIKARSFYSYSFRKNNNNYRALYKLARYNHNTGRKDLAWAQYTRIEDKLVHIAKQKVLQPREAEYLFKVWYCKLKLSSDEKYLQEQSSLIGRIRRIFEEVIDAQEFYDDFYQEKSRNYKMLVKQRLNIQLNKIKLRERHGKYEGKF